MKYIPLGDRIIVERIEQEGVTRGGIIIPDAAKERPQEGVVVAVGLEATGIQIGNTVVFSKYAGSEIKIEGRDGLILCIDDVMAIKVPS